MPKVSYSPAQRIAVLKKVKALMEERGLPFHEAVRRVGIAPNTYYKWMKLYGAQLEIEEKSNPANRAYRDATVTLQDLRDIGLAILERIREEVMVPKPDGTNIRALAQAAQAVASLGRLLMDISAAEAQMVVDVPKNAEEVRERLERVRQHLAQVYGTA